MRTNIVRLLLAFILVSLFSFSLFQYSKPEKQTLGIEAQKDSQKLPIRLVIPVINVSARIQQVGVTSKGEMDVPSVVTDAGWFRFGSRPGEVGSAVIAGHLDGQNGEAGVFSNLNKLKKGDKIFIKDDKDNSITFVVRESRIYSVGYAEEVFSDNSGRHLNLVTCDGVWDEGKKSYSKRLVVFTNLVP